MVTLKEHVRSVRTKVTVSVMLLIGVLAAAGSVVGKNRIVPQQQLNETKQEYSIQDIQKINEENINVVKHGKDNSRQLLKKRERSQKNHRMHRSDSGGQKQRKKRTKQVDDKNRVQVNGTKHLKTTGTKVVLLDGLRGDQPKIAQEPKRHQKNGHQLDGEDLEQDQRVHEDYRTGNEKLYSGNKAKPRKHKVYISKDVKNRSRTHWGQ